MIWILACADMHPVDLGSYPDKDGDGYTINSDSRDLDPSIHPGAQEIWYDGVDQDCDWNDDDQDYDGYPLGEDCDDQDQSVNPGGVEVWYDGVDQDCDGNDDDRDGDGDPWRSGTGDCDDDDPLVHRNATEIWYDGVDQDCDGNDTDQDEDGFEAEAVGGIDCDDEEPDVPGWLYVDADRDGYGAGDLDWYCGDPTGWSSSDGDCDDDDHAVNPGEWEICDDGVDNDCSGDANRCAYHEHWTSPYEPSAVAILAPGTAGTLFGSSLAIGDLDDDGDFDLAVGAREGGDDDEGQLVVAYGPLAGVESAWDQTLDGGGAGGYATHALTAASDSDFDGLDEIWVGIPGADRGGDELGAVVLVGEEATWDLVDSDVILWGLDDGGHLGSALASVDLDGDGFPDLAAGAPGARRVDVVFGPHETLLAADASWSGGARFGGALAAAPDVDGDGVSELLIAAPDDGTVTLRTGAGDELARLDGPVGVGEALASADFDDDGLADIAIGSPTHASSWIVHGPLSGTLTLGTAYTNGLDRHGAAMVPCDLDADGRTGLAIGSPGEQDATDPSGITTLDLDVAWEWASGRQGNGAGAALACGDLDGDGIDDLAVGGPYASDVHILAGGGL